MRPEHAPAPATVLVIGAGWSGLSCAIELVRLGHRPIVVDAAPQAGGRARAVDWTVQGECLRVDNGQHLLLGAYADTLAMLERVGVHAAALEHHPFALAYPDGWRLAAVRAPAPWHLVLGVARTPSLALRERWALVRWVATLERMLAQAPAQASAADLLAPQPKELVRRLWRPLCLAALNVEPAQASAHIFGRVLLDSIAGDARASALLVPRVDLSALFPDAAAAWLAARGASLRLRATVRALRPLAQGWQVQLPAEWIEARRVVLALPPARAAALLRDLDPALDETVATLLALRTAPIATVYLRYAQAPRLARPFYPLLDAPARGRYGQWVFDRGALVPAPRGARPGLLSVVISGAGAHEELSRDALCQAVARQVGEELGLAAPSAQFAIVEKNATLVPAPGLRRPPTQLPAAGLLLAGDSAQSPYPSTIEGSVRAGVQAARAIGPALP